MKNLYSLSNVLPRCLLFSLLCFPATLPAQLTAWQYKDVVSIQESSGTAKSNYQVLLSLNTQALITAGKMKPDGSDLRFSAGCDGTNLYSHYIESGINTANTRVWVKVTSLPANASTDIFMFYGNPAAASVAGFAATFPRTRIITSTTLIHKDTTSWNYDWIEIRAGGSLIFDPLFSGTFTMTARRIIIGGTVNGDGAGHKGTVSGNGEGPGGGQAAYITAGGGAGHGATGGMGAYCCSSPNYAGVGGTEYGDATSIAIQPGSGGGPPGLVGSGTSGGNGGIAFVLKAAYVTISSALTANGTAGGSTEYCGGGGSGGGIMIRADQVEITNSGVLFAKGGAGGSATGNVYYGGGGGAGGRIKIFYQSFYSNLGTVNVTGGLQGGGGSPPGKKGENGTFHQERNYEVKEPVAVICEGLNPQLNIVASKSAICRTEPVKFTAFPGNGGSNPAFQWKLNGQDIPGANSRTYTSAELNDLEQISCSMTSSATCIGAWNTAVSDTVTMTVLPQLLAAFTCTPDSVAAQDSVIQFNSTAEGAATWLWDFGDGNTDNVESPTHIYPNIGFYTVTLTVTGACGADSSWRMIEIKHPDSIVYGTPSIIETALLDIYPNPTNGLVTIHVQPGNPGKLDLYIEDLAGRKIYQDHKEASGDLMFNLDISAQPAGVYIMKVRSATDVQVRKIVLH